MRWLVLTDDYPPLAGGVATWSAAAVAALEASGQEVVVYARARPGLAPQVHPIRGRSFARWGGWWARLATRRARREADRILATTWPVASRLPTGGPPLDVVFHGSDLTRPTPDPAGRARVLARADRRLAVSRFLAGLAGGAAVLPVPIDPAEPVLLPDRPDRWAFVGRAVPAKGGDRFVRLVAAAGAQGVLVGDGPALAGWRALADRLGARVEFHGALPHHRALEALATCHLLVHLPRPHPDGSGAEGLGLVCHEAAARGIPCAVSPIGGAPEAAGPGLVLADPDDARASAAAVRAWWSAARGEEARAWLASTHGSARFVAALSAGSRDHLEER